MLSDFAKFDDGERVSLDEMFKDIKKILHNQDASLEDLLKVANTIIPAELHDRYPGRIQVGATSYLAKEGSFRPLPALGMVFFEQEGYGEPVYVTVAADAITAVVWYPRKKLPSSAAGDLPAAA